MYEYGRKTIEVAKINESGNYRYWVHERPKNIPYDARPTTDEMKAWPTSLTGVARGKSELSVANAVKRELRKTMVISNGPNSRAAGMRMRQQTPKRTDTLI